MLPWLRLCWCGLCASSRAGNGFDKLAKPYRWMEYLSFGPLLWRARIAWLHRMDAAQQALVLGDGDGRFTAALLRRNAAVQVTAVDASEAMLAAMQRRVSRQGDASRVSVVHQDARTFLPAHSFDLICTHFFLDCLDQAETGELVRVCAAALPPHGLWVVTEFAIPDGFTRPLARGLVRWLYLCFRLLTGLRVTRLPDYAAAMRDAGLACAALRTSLGGLLRSEIWAQADTAATKVGQAASNRT